MSEEIKYLKKTNFAKQLKELSAKLQGKRVFIYGAGLLFQIAYKKYDFSCLNIIGISDMKFEETCDFMGIKAVKPDDIASLNPDVILVSIKEYKSLVKKFTNQFPEIEVLPLIKKPEIPAFLRRNINHNFWIESHGLHGKKPKNLSAIKKLSMKLDYLFGKIDIPQLEFNLTTKCTLRCKHCSNFIPQLQGNEHCPISIEEFKLQLTNLLKSANKIRNLLLLGGEPLLVKNLEEYLEFAASKNKVEKVWIVTNGTLLLSDKLIETAKKYRNKTVIWLSNYSKNEELKSKLKHDKILQQIKDAQLDYDYVEDLNWGYTSPIGTEKLRDDSKEYFRECSNNCVAVFGGKIYVCPRAGVFDLKGIYTPAESETIDLNKTVTKKQLKDFYSKESFSACNYCTVIEDRAKGKVIPALQID